MLEIVIIMKNEYPFLVELPKESGNGLKFEQRLFCGCGHKQKTKLTVRRILLKNPGNVYEDNHDIENVTCDRCGQKFSIFNNLIGLKQNQTVLVEVEFVSEALRLKGKTIRNLFRNKKYYGYDHVKDELFERTVKDLIFHDSLNSKIGIFIHMDETKNANSIGVELSGASVSAPLLFTANPNKNKRLDLFSLSNTKFFESFFSYASSVNYKGLEVAFDFWDELLSLGYDYSSIYKEKFFEDFRISKRINSEIREGKPFFYTMKKNMFGGESPMKRKFDPGDYVNRIQKMAEITSVMICFPPISTLLKTKGLEFVHSGFKKGYLAPQCILNSNNATNAYRITEVSCGYYCDTKQPKGTTPFPIGKGLQEGKNKRHEDDLKISPIIFKSISEPDDALVIYKFNREKILSKSEIEHIFQKYDSQSVVEVMSRIISSSNARDNKLNVRHINHILKNKIFQSESDNWVNLYYDTINSLNLIVEIIKIRKQEGKASKLGKLAKISDEKLFEIKTFEKLKVLHDEMTAVYRALEDESKDLKYRQTVAKHIRLNAKKNLFDFKVIPNLNELSKEGLVMHHCIYTYLNDIASGEYIAIRVKDTVSKERATMGVKVVNGKLYLQQLKGYYNSRPTALLIDNALDFCKTAKITIESGHLHQSDIQSNPSLERRMKEYLDPTSANILRAKMLSKK